MISHTQLLIKGRLKDNKNKLRQRLYEINKGISLWEKNCDTSQPTISR